MADFYLSFLKLFSLTTYDLPMIGVGLVLLFLLYKTLELKVFGPALEHIEQRERATTGAVETAAMMRQKAAALEERYEQELLAARVEANAERLQIINKSKEEAQAMLTKAEAEIAKELASGREKTEKQLKDCRLQVATESKNLADLLLKQVDSELSAH